MSFGIAHGDSHSDLAALLFGVPLRFTVTDPAFSEVKYPITYQRAQYIAQVADSYYYLPRLNEVWEVDMWTETLQSALDARNARAGTPRGWLRHDLPGFVPRHYAAFPFGVAW